MLFIAYKIRDLFQVCEDVLSASVFLSFAFFAASEELMEHLRGENQNLLEIVEKMRSEMTSIRHVHIIYYRVNFPRHSFIYREFGALEMLP